MSSESDNSTPKPSQFSATKIAVLIAVAVVTGLAYTQFGDALSLENLAARETQLREFQEQNPVLVFGAAFLIYVLVTGLSLPGAAVLTLVFAWYFGFLRTVPLVSFASTAG